MKNGPKEERAKTWPSEKMNLKTKKWSKGSFEQKRF